MYIPTQNSEQSEAKISRNVEHVASKTYTKSIGDRMRPSAGGRGNAPSTVEFEARNNRSVDSSSETDFDRNVDEMQSELLKE